MKRLVYQVYVGKRSKLYDHCVESVKAYCERHGFDHIVQRSPILMITPDPFMTNRSKEATARLGYLPIYEKENALAYLVDYDQVAIIDSDVYVRDTAPSIFDAVDPESDFAGVLERDMPITPQYDRKIAQYSRMQYGMLPYSKLFDWNHKAGADFYNMGIMVLNQSVNKYIRRQTPLEFIRRPEFKPFVDGVGAWKWSTDQTLLNVWVKTEKMKVTNLSYHWNALFTGIHMDKIKDAHFVHFFLKDKLPERGENVDQLMDQV